VPVGDRISNRLRQCFFQIAARLELYRMIARPRLEALGDGIAHNGPVLDVAPHAISARCLDYLLITADKECH